MVGKKKAVSESASKRRTKQASTIEGREAQLILLAMDKAEERMRNGEATAQEICHFLKLGSTRNKKEMTKMDKEITLMDAKEGAIKSAENTEKKFAEAINAFRRYSGDFSGKDILDE